MSDKPKYHEFDRREMVPITDVRASVVDAVFEVKEFEPGPFGPAHSNELLEFFGHVVVNCGGCERLQLAAPISGSISRFSCLGCWRKFELPPEQIETGRSLADALWD